MIDRHSTSRARGEGFKLAWWSHVRKARTGDSTGCMFCVVPCRVSWEAETGLLREWMCVFRGCPLSGMKRTLARFDDGAGLVGGAVLDICSVFWSGLFVKLKRVGQRRRASSSSAAVRVAWVQFGRYVERRAWLESGSGDGLILVWLEEVDMICSCSGWL